MGATLGGAFAGEDRGAAREAEVRAVVAEILGDCRTGEPAEVTRHLDLVRLAREVSRVDVLGEVDAARRASFEATVAIAVRNVITNDPTIVSTGDAEVRRIVLRGDDDEAEVFLRQRDRSGFRHWSRWWLARRNDRWLLHDIGDVDSGIRLSLATAALVAAESEAGTDVGHTARIAVALRAAARALASGDALAAREMASEFEDEEIPALLAELRGIVLASTALASGLPDRALAALERERGTRPAADDAPVSSYLRALAHDLLGDHEACLAAARRYVEAIGGDADGWVAAGVALERLERKGEARDAYRAALLDDPANTEALVGLLASLDPALPAERTETYQVLSTVPDLGAVLDAVAYGLVARGAPARVEELAAAASSLSGDVRAQALLVLARARAADGRSDEGVAVLATLAEELLTTDPERYEDVLYLQLDLTRAAEGAEAALDAATDPFMAFPHLAQALVDEEKRDELLRLIAVYTEREPGDPSLTVFRGHFHSMNGDHAEAARAFRTAFGEAEAEDWERKSELHELTVRAEYAAGRGAALVDELAPRRMTVERLADAAFVARDGAMLELLVQRQSKADPGDPGLPLWTAAAAYVRNDFAGTIGALASPPAGLTSDPALAGLADELLVRSFIRLERLDEALLAARESAERDGDPLHLAVVHAVRGDVLRTGAALATLEAIGYRSADFHADPDLGQALRSDGMQELALRFGPPAE